MAAPLPRRQHPCPAGNRPRSTPVRRPRRRTTTSARTYAGNVDLVVNTHWHSDHVGGNALLRAPGSAIAADTPEADAITSRAPGSCAGRRCPTCTLGDLYRPPAGGISVSTGAPATGTGRIPHGTPLTHEATGPPASRTPASPHCARRTRTPAGSSRPARPSPTPSSTTMP
ncbi:MBL fold metallo-hydrolase [Streptomyces sp. DT190]|uniref:MBL fold metallo-hydrolase n=1 Tax=unclassified Streptomyces TaxID=2593676 RepID=UPI003CECB202